MELGHPKCLQIRTGGERISCERTYLHFLLSCSFMFFHVFIFYVDIYTHCFILLLLLLLFNVTAVAVS